jgi:GAF domain-containing protein
MPITIGEELFGVFTVGSRTPRSFSAGEQRLLQALAQRAALAIDNARLHEQAEQRRREIEALYQADEHIYRSLRLDEVLQALVDVATDLLQPDKVSVWILEQRTQRIVVGASRGFSQATQAESPLPEEADLLRGHLGGGVVAIEDAQTDARLPASVIAVNRREQIRASLTAPIRIGSDVIGAFGLSYCQPRTFSEEQRRLLASLAQRAGLAIRNARLHEESEQQRQELAALYQADEALHRSLQLEAVLRALAREATEVLRAAKTLVMVWDRAHERLVVGAAHGFSAAIQGYSARPDEASINTAALGASIVAIEDVRTDPRLSAGQRAMAEQEGVLASLNGGIRIGGEVFGAFSVNFAEPHTPSPDEKRLLVALAGRAALAIQNARLHQESEGRRQELEALYHADEALHRSLRLDEVLQALVDLAAVILRSDSAGVWMLDASNRRMVARAARGMSSSYIQRLNELATLDEAPIVGEVLTNDLLVVPDLQADPRLSPRMQALMAAEGFHSSLTAPIRLNDEFFGTFSVGFRQTRAFGQREQRLLVALGQRAGLAIQNAQLYEQAQQAATLEERQRLARELHDAVTQTLFSTALLAEVLPEVWEADPDEGRQRLAELRRLTRGALAEMRALLLELRPDALGALPLHDLLRQVADATAGRTRLAAIVRMEGTARPLPPAVQLALYRLAQEALNNVVKHAKARQATVTLRYTSDGGVYLRLEDDGCGFDPSVIPAGHLGVGIMRERADAIGARFELTSRPGVGTMVEVAWFDGEGSHQAS